MKFVILGPSWPYVGGIVHYNIWLSNFLKRRGHEVVIFSYKKLVPKIFVKDKKVIDKTQPNRSEVECQEVINNMNPFNWLNVAKKINTQKPDFVIIYWWTPLMALMYHSIASHIKAKIICLMHNVLPHEKTILDKPLTKYALKKVDYFILHGQKEKELLLKLMKKINPSNVSVVFHPSYEFQFKTKEISRKEARKRLNLKGKGLLYFGYVRPYKGLKYLIDAMPYINKKYNDITLLIVGEFWMGLREQIDQQIKDLKLGNVRIFASYIPDEEVGYYFQAVDAVILPYESATSSGIIQIAFSYLKPVIATDVGVFSEIISDKLTGIIIPPKNPEAIANAVFQFYEQLDLKKMSANIKKEAYKFSWNNLIDIIESFIGH